MTNEEAKNAPVRLKKKIDEKLLKSFFLKFFC